MVTTAVREGEVQAAIWLATSEFRQLLREKPSRFNDPEWVMRREALGVSLIQIGWQIKYLDDAIPFDLKHAERHERIHTEFFSLSALVFEHLYGV